MFHEELGAIEAADFAWGTRLGQILDARSYGEEFGPEHNTHNASAKASFLADNSIRHPDLIYPKPDLDNIEKVVAQLSTLRSQIERSGGDDNALSHLYLAKIDELTVEQLRMIAIWNGDVPSFVECERFLYGEVDKKLFDYAFAVATGKDVPLTGEIDQNVVKRYVESVAPGLGTLLIDTKNGERYKSDKIVAFFQGALTHIPILSSWEVVVGNGREIAIVVNSTKRQIIVPPHKTAAFGDLKNLVFHELVGHAVWQEQAKKSKLMILQRGLDRVGKVSEGVATVIAQTMTGNHEIHGGVDGYLAVGLTLGMDRGGKGRDFREVFEWLVEYYIQKDTTHDIQNARELAWSRTVRTFRGVPKGVVGVCSIKPLIYLDGNIAVSKALANDPDFLHKLANGRYDPTNERHVACLRQVENM